ncbi:MAG: MotA/TolQ/ExbB proton channel family protein [Gordonibacter sp.]|nr:MotA/TolQ/ExbB proton channel family protein [Gordonibacter sp.]
MNATLYLKDILHLAAQGLMVPVMILLVLLICYALFCIGSVITEYFTERRHFKAHMPSVINALHDAPYDQVNRVIESAALLKTQKAALTMVASNMGLPDDDLFALAKTEMSKLYDAYQGIVGRNDLVTKVAPMMGLMATLIPLGPGIVAMGQGDVDQLAQSLLIAFDGTVAGLVAAVVSMTVAKVRKRWYSRYAGAMEALMTCLLEKAAQARRDNVVLPHGFEGAFKQARDKDKRTNVSGFQETLSSQKTPVCGCDGEAVVAVRGE